MSAPASLLLLLVTALPFAARVQSLAAPNSQVAPPPPAVTSSPDDPWFEPTIGPRQRHTAINDPVRDRMVVFGGYDG